MNFLSFWRFDTHRITDDPEYTEATVISKDDDLKAMATVGNLLDMVDIGRLITTRDRTFPLSNVGAWAEIPTQTAYREYLRFLTIKVLSVNVPALALSPSWYIDQLWHSHILDTEAYAQLVGKWPGRLQHDPVPPGGDEGQLERLRRTLRVYEQLFKESPLRSAATKAIWSEDPQSLMDMDGSTSTVPIRANQSLHSRNTNTIRVYPSVAAPPPKDPEPEIQPPPYINNPLPFQIFMKERTGKLSVVEGSRTMTILDLKNKYMKSGGPPVEFQSLMFSGNHLEDTGTLEEYNIQKESTINVGGPRLNGC